MLKEEEQKIRIESFLLLLKNNARDLQSSSVDIIGTLITTITTTTTVVTIIMFS